MTFVHIPLTENLALWPQVAVRETVNEFAEWGKEAEGGGDM